MQACSASSCCTVGPLGGLVNILVELQEKKGNEQWECLEYTAFNASFLAGQSFWEEACPL